MNRDAPLQRHTELGRDPEKARAFADRGRQPLKRTTSPRQKRERKALSVEEARLQAAFRAGARAQGCCVVCGYDGVFWDSHHAIAKAKLKKLFPLGVYRDEDGRWKPIEKHTVLATATEVRTRYEVRWDSRNALRVCRDPAPKNCHGRHTDASERLPRRALRPENFEFAAELAIGWILDAEYPGQERAAA